MLARFLLALALALLCGSDCRAASGDIDLPGEFAVTPIAQRLVLNGLPLEVAAVSAALALRPACDLIAGQWSRVRPAAVIGCRKSGDWLMVTRRAGSKLQTAQLRQSTDGVTGFISQVDLRFPAGQSAAPRLPLPMGARVVSVLQSAGRKASRASSPSFCRCLRRVRCASSAPMPAGVDGRPPCLVRNRRVRGCSSSGGAWSESRRWWFPAAVAAAWCFSNRARRDANHEA